MQILSFPLLIRPSLKLSKRSIRVGTFGLHVKVYLCLFLIIISTSSIAVLVNVPIFHVANVNLQSWTNFFNCAHLEKHKNTCLYITASGSHIGTLFPFFKKPEGRHNPSLKGNALVFTRIFIFEIMVIRDLTIFLRTGCHAA